MRADRARGAKRTMRANSTPATVVAGLGLLVLVVFGVVWPSVRAGGFAVSGAVVVPATLLVFLATRGRRGGRTP